MGEGADVLEQFCLLAKNARGRACVQIILEATASPGLFAYGELLDMPNIQELKGTEHASSFELLRLFAHGSWSDYKASAAVGTLPPLSPKQELKMKQLTVVSLAETAKVLPYDLLMEQLEITNIRELEDLLINECMYKGIIRGKLAQQQRCLEVHYAVGRDIRPGQLDNMITALHNWVGTSDELLKTIEEKVAWAGEKAIERSTQKADIDSKIDEMKKLIKPEVDRGQHEGMFLDGATGSMEYMQMEEDRTGNRTKRRR
mmetsp:Transcript_39123/g.74971  ORF Transcript_39123/g.74971 Transcript_39123/m.74971 type:complete len:259 (+) Transcript_39123:288-1064(+)|eukprot:CAMPEP_0114226662 /NCGR_PEP_ID=MMETSP0058-20121206/1356_1 /TAXON_ID=36894 /ORGANISM="Pyramimonas parkeae, CCMP726" /LENGTH=258 /DNA_ID=CAMNT_0001337411 /DNA_START=281 /DNA_END=1057 /DNA_ORIENTATION=-